jgi:hypothetical protein
MAAALAGGFGEARAALIHSSREAYFAGGGTLVSECVGQGCQDSSFVFGSPTGSQLWSVTEQVDFEAGITVFSYTVKNDSFNGDLENAITSFHVTNAGFALVGSFSPLGWLFLGDATTWRWQTESSMTAIAIGGEANFQVFLPGEVAVDFSPTAVDLGLSHSLQTSENWKISAPTTAAVPEPTSFTLLAFGLAGLAYWRRQHP